MLFYCLFLAPILFLPACFLLQCLVWQFFAHVSRRYSTNSGLGLSNRKHWTQTIQHLKLRLRQFLYQFERVKIRLWSFWNFYRLLLLIPYVLFLCNGTVYLVCAVLSIQSFVFSLTTSYCPQISLLMLTSCAPISFSISFQQLFVAETNFVWHHNIHV